MGIAGVVVVLIMKRDWDRPLRRHTNVAVASHAYRSTRVSTFRRPVDCPLRRWSQYNTSARVTAYAMVYRSQ